ncbi:MAG TPA: MotA/TolQ/ExbB proton channel family protein [Thermoanaerobaculia bacterium]|nr:MotA/TolQ/ExbB proton channel family protein [Thermoanaerobaculia bacterium]
MVWMRASSAVLAQLPGAEREGIFDLFLGSGAMGKGVFLLLVLFSVISWSIMLGKWFQLAKAGRHTRRFLEIFRKSRKFSEVNAATGRHFASPLVGLFQAGYVEVDAQVKARREEEGTTSGRYRLKSLIGVERSLRRALAVEIQLLAKGTAFLATTAAASPFIGLFGTVWGIMIAFNDIGTTGSTSIVAVAPGIAEALINTAAGLAAAIPALVGYNYFGARLRALRTEMEDFILEFLNLAERNFT